MGTSVDPFTGPKERHITPVTIVNIEKETANTCTNDSATATLSTDDNETITDISSAATSTTEQHKVTAKKPLVVATEVEDDDGLSGLLSAVDITFHPSATSNNSPRPSPHSSPKSCLRVATDKSTGVDDNPLSLSRSNSSRSGKPRNSLTKYTSILKRQSSFVSLGDSSVLSASSSRSKGVLSTNTSHKSAPASPETNGIAEAIPMKRTDSNVSFHSVNIREYDRTIGDNPSCSYGIPIGLDWSHSSEISVNLDDYEKAKSYNNGKKIVPRISAVKRESLLKMNLGYTDEEIKKHLKDTKRIQRSRSLTDIVSPYWRIHHACQSASRKIKRGFKKNKKKTNKTSHELAVEDAIKNSSSSLSLTESSSKRSLSHDRLDRSKEYQVSLNDNEVTKPISKVLAPKNASSCTNQIDRSSGSTSSLDETLEF